MRGFYERCYYDQVNLMTLAYNTGMLSRESKRKPKSLEYFLDKIDKHFHGNKYKNVPVDTKKSREILEQIEKRKGG